MLDSIKRFASLAYKTNLRFFSSRGARNESDAQAALFPGLQAKNKQAGFSLVELNLSITILGFLIVGVLGVITNFFVIITRNNVTVDMTVDSQSLLRNVVEELRYGAGVRNTNTIADANAPTNGWNTSNNDFVIIVAVPAVDSDNQYIIDPDTGSPYLNELVYFKSGRVLYKRVLANPNATGNTLTTSCPEAEATDLCPKDGKLIDDLESMVFTLYDQDDVVTIEPLDARSIKIDLGLEHDTFGSPLTVDNSIRVTLRNTF